MKLLQLCAGQIRLGLPLPWNVRTGRGDLLLGKGHPIGSRDQLESLLERGMYVDEDEYERHRQQAAAARHDPFYVWTEMLRRCAVLLREPGREPRFPELLQELAVQLREASCTDPDIGAFELMQAERVGYPVLHSVRTGYLCALVARRLQLGSDATRSLVSAALTMNIGMLELQQQLCTQRQPPTQAQREAILSHPQRGFALLGELGVTDTDWLRAVVQHHELEGGDGYPAGLAEVDRLAAIVQHADVYLAQLAPRHARPALPVQEAARRFFVRKGGAMNPVASAVVKEMGLYPPGAYVKLANGETAVVVRRGESAATPVVYSLTNAEGIAFAEAVRRDTRQARHRVTGAVAAANVMVRIDRQRLFGLD